MRNQGLSILEIILVVAILAVVLVVAVYALKPQKIMAKSRDDQRLSDLTTLATAINLYLADKREFTSISLNTIYDSTEGSSATRTKNDGSGWVPVNFTNITSGSPLATLGIDPKNDKSSGFYYRFGADPLKKTYELDCAFESTDNLSKQTSDGGNNAQRYEVGTDLTILP